ncbi:hypothetical protein AWB64_00116 [Caballeronia sordidicola]|uniref:Uncharacterized protein n=1 Tax=Caballeronia sordidicola TaxID=196367 RepID=A0A158ENW7_CABSO|nr:hypothetical protein AWB64_00116 [Caballeronia sordidicola]
MGAAMGSVDPRPLGFSEAVVAATHGVGEDSAELRGFITLIEVRIQRVHVHPDLLMEGHINCIDPDK